MIAFIDQEAEEKAEEIEVKVKNSFHNIYIIHLIFTHTIICHL